MDQVYIAPSNALEKKMAETWEEILCLDRVGIYDNFFALGGTSILAVHLIAAMKKKLSIDLPIVKLFQYTDINSLAEYLSQNQNESPAYDEIKNRAQRRRSAFAKKKR